MKNEQILNDLKDLYHILDGTIDGHSWGEETTGTSKVSLKDLIDIENRVENLIKKYDKEWNPFGV